MANLCVSRACSKCQSCSQLIKESALSHKVQQQRGCDAQRVRAQGSKLQPAGAGDQKGTQQQDAQAMDRGGLQLIKEYSALTHSTLWRY
eukprot:1141946-Pelagomonas_calceolata.AAC.7